MSNGNKTTKALATIGAIHLTVNTLAGVYKAYLTQRLGPEYAEWRANNRAERYRRNNRLTRHFIGMCEKHGLTMNARFHRWLLSVTDRLDTHTEQAGRDPDEYIHRAQEQVNRDRM